MVLWRFVRDRDRSLLWWSIAQVGLVLLSAALYPSIRDAPDLEKIFEQMPKTFRALLGAGVSITAPAGYLNARHFALVFPALILFFSIGLGGRAIAGSEEDGSLELVLSLPISRRRLAAERFAAVQLLIVGFGVVGAAALLAVAPLFGLLVGLGPLDLAVATATITAMGMFHASIAFAVGAALGRRSMAIGASAAVAVAGYVLYGASVTTQSLHGLRLFSPWYWYAGRNLLLEGGNPAGVVLPLVGAALLVAVALRRFDVRDLR
jgi:ABC-2 type transport system permease protein